MNIEDVRTVKDAINFYNSPKSRDIVEAIQARRDLNYLNHNYANALCLTDVMLRNASSRICILAGDNVFDFLNILREPFKLAYDAIVRNNGHIKIISLGVGEAFNDRVTETFRKFSNTFNNIEFKKGLISDPLQVSHYIICDNAVRIEQPHLPITNESSAGTIKATVYFRTKKEEVDALETDFNALYNRL